MIEILLQLNAEKLSKYLFLPLLVLSVMSLLYHCYIYHKILCATMTLDQYLKS